MLKLKKAPNVLKGRFFELESLFLLYMPKEVVSFWEKEIETMTLLKARCFELCCVCAWHPLCVHKFTAVSICVPIQVPFESGRGNKLHRTMLLNIVIMLVRLRGATPAYA